MNIKSEYLSALECFNFFESGGWIILKEWIVLKRLVNAQFFLLSFSEYWAVCDMKSGILYLNFAEDQRFLQDLYPKKGILLHP